MELYRIYRFKKIIIYFFIVGILALVFYRENVRKIEIEGADDYIKYLNVYDVYNIVDYGLNLYNSYEDAEKDDILYNIIEDIFEKYDSMPDEAEYAVELISEETEYIQKYNKEISDNIASINRYVNNPLYATGDSYFMKNAYKTADYMKAFKELEVKPSNHKAVSVVLDSGYIQLFIIIMLFLIVTDFFDERKKGMWQMVHLAKGGRIKLAAKRMAILLFTTFLFTFVAYSICFGISYSIYGGADFMANYIQSSEYFKICNWIVDARMYMLLFILSKALIIFAVMSVVYCICVCFRERITGWIAVIAVFGAEFILYQAVAEKSSWVFLKQINLVDLILNNNALSGYRNWGVFQFIFNEHKTVIINAVVLSVVAAAMIMIISVRMRPGNGKKLKLKIIDYIRKMVSALMSRLPLCLMELWKILISQKLIIVAIGACIIVSGIETGRGVIYDYDMKVVKSIYKDIDGFNVNDATNYIEAYDIVTEQLNAEAENTYDTMVVTTRRKASQKVKKNIEYVRALNEKGINDAVVMCQYDYEKLFGSEMYDNQESISIMAVLMISILIFNVYSYEKKKNMKDINRYCRGRRKLYINKLLVSVMITVFVWLVTYVVNAVKIYNTFEFNCLDCGAESIMFIGELPFSLSIRELFICILIYRFIILLALAVIMMSVSAMTSYIMSFGVAMVPVLLHMPKFLGMKWGLMVSPVSILAITENFNEYGDLFVRSGMFACFILVAVWVAIKGYQKVVK